VDKVQSVAVGNTIDTVSELQLLSIRAADGRTVYLRDVADISLGRA
jgi:multidrug efflux pump subunit AcrB